MFLFCPGLAQQPLNWNRKPFQDTDVAIEDRNSHDDTKVAIEDRNSHDEFTSFFFRHNPTYIENTSVC